MTEDTLLPRDNQEPSNYLESLIGPGGKFHRENKDEALEEMAKGKYQADRYIELKNKQFDDLREDYLKLMEEGKSRAKLEELIDKLENGPSSTTQTATDRQPGLKPEDIENLVSKKITENETARHQQSNFNVVKAKLTERFGDNYAPVVRERISALGLSEQDFNDWARKSPNAVINALGINETSRENFQTPPQTSRTFRPVTDKKRTWSYYQEIKKTNPKLYTDSKTMNQMLSDAEALGPEFEDGDFHSRNTP
jgi:hypothetical protein